MVINKYSIRKQVASLNLGIPDIAKERDIKKKILELLKKDLYNTYIEEIESEDLKTSPYPNHKGYTRLRKNLNIKDRKYMKENFIVTDTGKILIPKLSKVVSVFSMSPNGDDILSGVTKDKNGVLGKSKITYVNGGALQREGLSLFNTREESDKFIDILPGEDQSKRISNLFTLFGLTKTGYWNPEYKRWESVDMGFVSLCLDNHNGLTYCLMNNQGKLFTHHQKKNILQPSLVVEDIAV